MRAGALSGLRLELSSGPQQPQAGVRRLTLRGANKGQRAQSPGRHQVPSRTGVTVIMRPNSIASSSLQYVTEAELDTEAPFFLKLMEIHSEQNIKRCHVQTASMNRVYLTVDQTAPDLNPTFVYCLFGQSSAWLLEFELRMQISSNFFN